MEISLRQAHALQLEVKQEIDKLVINPVISLSPLESNTSEQISNHLEQTMSDMDLKTRLVNSYYSIRKLVSDANTKNKVSEILVDIETYTDLIKYYKLLENGENIKSEEYINKYFEHQLSNKDPYGRLTSIAVNTLNKEVIEKYSSEIKKLQKEIKSLKDKLLHLNVATKVVLDQSTISTLTEVGLV